MKRCCLLLLLSLGVSAPAIAQVNALPSLPHLLVKGEATRSVVPDRFKVGVNLESTDLKPEKARETVQGNLAGVIQAFKDSHAIVDSIDATTFSVGPDYKYENGKQVFLGTKATRRVEGTFASAEDTRNFLSRIQAGEHVLLTGIEPSISNEVEVRSELKRQAMQQTRDTAELLAKAYGTRIKGLYSVSDVAPSFAYGIEAGQWPRTARGAGALPVVFDTPSAMDSVTTTGSRITPESLEVGTIELSENLYAIFLIGN